MTIKRFMTAAVLAAVAVAQPAIAIAQTAPVRPAVSTVTTTPLAAVRASSATTDTNQFAALGVPWFLLLLALVPITFAVVEIADDDDSPTSP